MTKILHYLCLTYFVDRDIQAKQTVYVLLSDVIHAIVDQNMSSYQMPKKKKKQFKHT